VSGVNDEWVDQIIYGYQSLWKEICLQANKKAPRKVQKILMVMNTIVGNSAWLWDEDIWMQSVAILITCATWNRKFSFFSFLIIETDPLR
jgi:hypothetical protein